MKIVLDSNVLVAAFATHGACHLLLESCVLNHQIVLSTYILGEVTGKLERKIKVPAATVADIRAYLLSHAIVRDPKALSGRVSRDANDDPVLALAAEAEAEFLVTGDKDLLVLGFHGKVRIVTPRQFADILRKA